MRYSVIQILHLELSGWPKTNKHTTIPDTSVSFVTKNCFPKIKGFRKAALHIGTSTILIIPVSAIFFT